MTPLGPRRWAALILAEPGDRARSRARLPALTRCKKLRRSRSCGAAAMTPVTFQPRPTSARPTAPPITAQAWPRWPIARLGRALRPTSVNNLYQNQS